jgi:hypothetical protein
MYDCMLCCHVWSMMKCLLLMEQLFLWTFENTVKIFTVHFMPKPWIKWHTFFTRTITFTNKNFIDQQGIMHWGDKQKKLHNVAQKEATQQKHTQTIKIKNTVKVIFSTTNLKPLNRASANKHFKWQRKTLCYCLSTRSSHTQTWRVI